MNGILRGFVVPSHSRTSSSSKDDMRRVMVVDGAPPLLLLAGGRRRVLLVVPMVTFNQFPIEIDAKTWSHMSTHE